MGSGVFILPAKAFTFRPFAAIIKKDMCIEEESLGNAPQSELEDGESPAGRAHRESPPSSEPNAFRPLGFAGRARYSVNERTHLPVRQFGWYRERLRPMDEGELFFGGEHHV